MMRGSRTTTLIVAGALGVGGLVGLASPAFAETPPHEGEEMVLVIDDGGVPEGPGDLAPAPTPDPEIDDKAPPPPPEPEPEPQPEDDLPIGIPGEDPDPEDDLPVGIPGDDDDEDPDPGDGPDEVTADGGGCQFTHGCDEEPTPDGHCFDDAGNVVDPSQCLTSDDGGSTDGTDGTDGVDVDSSTTDRGALPRTGAGVAALALAGGALTGAGAALRKLARR
jgi:hypothetical protein